MFLDKRQIQIVDFQTLDLLKKHICEQEGPFIQIGPGEGNISKLIPNPKILVQPSLKYKEHLINEDVYWVKVQDLKSLMKDNHVFEPKCMCANLPFNQCLDILKHCVYHFKSIETFLVVVQQSWYKNMLKKGKRLYYIMTHLFNSEFLFSIKGCSFKPKVGTRASVILLKPKLMDPSYISFLQKIPKFNVNLSKIFKTNLSRKTTDLSSDQLYTFFKKHDHVIGTYN